MTAFHEGKGSNSCNKALQHWLWLVFMKVLFCVSAAPCLLGQKLDVSDMDCLMLERIRDKAFNRRRSGRSENGRLWTIELLLVLLCPWLQALWFVCLVWRESWRLILPQWTCLYTGDCRQLLCCNGSILFLAWVSICSLCTRNWNYVQICMCSINRTVLLALAIAVYKGEICFALFHYSRFSAI